jgi:hypothetical protein
MALPSICGALRYKPQSGPGDENETELAKPFCA